MDHITTAGTAAAAKKRGPQDTLVPAAVLLGTDAIVVGILVGWLAPTVGIAMEPIGTTFVNSMKMLIGPIVFLTIVGGIASVADLKKVGMTGLKALTYFQVGTIFAMVFGLVAINIFRARRRRQRRRQHDRDHRLRGQAHRNRRSTRSGGSSSTHIIPTSIVGPVR